MKNMEDFSEKDWLDRLYRKSNSNRTVRVVKTSMAIFDYFCQDMGTTRSKLEEEFREKMAQNPPDVRNVCLSSGKKKTVVSNVLDVFYPKFQLDKEELVLKSYKKTAS